MLSITNPDVFRHNVANQLSALLSKDTAPDLSLDPTVSINIEKGVYNYAIKEATQRKIVKKWENRQFVQLYKDRLRSVFLNMQSSDLAKQIVSGEISPQTVAFMTHQEMQPDHWTQLIQRKIKRDESKYTDTTQASTDMFTCKKCRSKRCTYYEMQTRSADEPATIFITCLDCGKHWKS